MQTTTQIKRLPIGTGAYHTFSKKLQIFKVCARCRSRDRGADGAPNTSKTKSGDSVMIQNSLTNTQLTLDHPHNKTDIRAFCKLMFLFQIQKSVHHDSHTAKNVRGACV